MKYLVIDIGGTYTKYAVMDEECTFYTKDRIPTVCDTLEHFTDMLAGLYQENENICEEDGDHIQGIALSSAGVIDSETGFMYNGGSLFCIKNINIVELLEKQCGVPVTVENDAKCAALAELWRGSTVDATKVSYKWAAMDASVTSTASTGYDADFGIGWRKLSDATGRYTGTSSNTITIYAAAVDSYAVFKCCAQDTDSASASYNTKFFDVATFIDNSDPLQIIVTSTGGDVFKNGQGSTVLTAVCYQAGAEVDAAGGGTYTWTKYNKDGAVDTSWGTNGSKRGKTLSVSSADVDTKATFMVVVTL